MTVNHSLFRLRNDTTIVGYLKLYANGKSEFSKDMFWWHGDRIQYDEKDAFSGQYDRNNRALFNNDVVAIRKGTTPKEKTNCLLTFDEERGSFTFIEIETEQLFELFLNDLPLFHKSELTFVGMHIPDH